MERLDKILAGTGRWSRKEVKDLCKAGRVKVSGAVVKRPEEKVERQGLDLQVDGQPVVTDTYTYLMLHKPAGLVSATEDKREPTVLELLPAHLRRIGLFPVGRLDKDTEGLLLLTNDGDLAHRLLAPGKHVDKVYYVRVAEALEQSDVTAFAEGMILGDGLHCLSAGLELLGEKEALVTLREGKFHQIKRMLAACGKPVVYLKRLSMGGLSLDGALAAGEWRTLAERELLLLQGNE